LMPNRGKYEVAELVLELFGQTLHGPLIDGGERAVWTEKLFDHFNAEVESQVAQPYHEIELPLAPVLVDMELEGIRIDSSVLQKMSLEMGTQMEELTRSI